MRDFLLRKERSKCLVDSSVDAVRAIGIGHAFNDVTDVDVAVNELVGFGIDNIHKQSGTLKEVGPHAFDDTFHVGDICDFIRVTSIAKVFAVGCGHRIILADNEVADDEVSIGLVISFAVARKLRFDRVLHHAMDLLFFRSKNNR